MQKGKKNKLIYSILLLLCIVGFWWFENFYTATPSIGTDSENITSDIPDFFYPKVEKGQLVNHSYFTLSYLEEYEQAQFVIYRLDAAHLTYEDRNRPYFNEDPKVGTKSADWRNYKNSGFDRGHLCPAGDRRFSEYAYNETFYTSNISPQNKEFNAGIWNRLELQVRRWAKRYKSVYVATAGVLDNSLPGIGDEEVAVPDAFYKIVARGEGEDLKVIAFLIPHKEQERPLSDFIVSVDQIEKLTGIDFLPGLEDEFEDKVEAASGYGKWKF